MNKKQTKMAKVSPISIKYCIKAKFFAESIVEKPDVIGAIFGQTEGLLGEDLELRELQKKGKIGRIEVTINTAENKSNGEIEIPTALDKAETSIIAATLETIERIGPADAKIKIETIEDVRGGKREYVLERAKKLLEGLGTQPGSRELSLEITSSVREGRVVEYGEEKLAAGPEVETSEEIVVVEGRADVLNLLRNGVKNAISMNGTYLPETIKKLTKEKIVTLFVDGDRGGLLIAKGAVASAKVDFIAQAPAGKEVEELESKEIVVSLRGKETVNDFFGKRQRMRFEEETANKTEQKEEVVEQKQEIQQEQIEKLELTEEETGKVQAILSELEGTKVACLVDRSFAVLKKVPISALSRLHFSVKPYALIINGRATNTIAKIAEKLGCNHLIAKNFAVNTETRVNLVSV